MASMYKITGYSGSASVLTLPTTQDGIRVDEIAKNAFSDTSTVTEIYGDSILSIEGGIFEDYSMHNELTKVSFPNCTYIGEAALAGTGIKSLNLPNCTTIDLMAFQYCQSLSIASLPKCSSIPGYCFNECQSLISLYLMSTSVCGLDQTAFMNTPMIFGSGSIFVPSSLASAYKASPSWSNFSSRIVGI